MTAAVEMPSEMPSQEVKTENTKSLLDMEDTDGEEFDFSSLDHMSVHPNFLHTNSTSHKWALGAIAELIDNAQDPDCGAENLYIDVDFDSENDPILVVEDDGSGISRENLKLMFGMGFCSKDKSDLSTIGRYGNGFKSGTMRIGNDVLVFTQDAKTKSVGMLSQTFLADKKAEEVFVPLLTWDKATNTLKFSPKDNSKALETITSYSEYTTEERLLKKLDTIKGHGTRIEIYTLRRDEGDGTLELDFSENRYDIRLTDVKDEFGRSHRAQERLFQSRDEDIPIDYSLRAYCEYLYLDPRMRITIRDKIVRTKRVKTTLFRPFTETYTPRNIPNVKADIIFGMNQPTQGHGRPYGMLMYHHGRLIKAYHKIGIQLQANDSGVGVVGIVQADFLTPTHNKQDFDDNRAYQTLIYNLELKLKDYWMYVKDEHDKDLKTQNWAQCDKCQKWRKLPLGANPPGEYDQWYCRMNKGGRDNCDLSEEEEDKLPEKQKRPPKRKAPSPFAGNNQRLPVKPTTSYRTEPSTNPWGLTSKNKVPFNPSKRTVVNDPHRQIFHVPQYSYPSSQKQHNFRLNQVLPQNGQYSTGDVTTSTTVVYGMSNNRNDIEDIPLDFFRTDENIGDFPDVTDLSDRKTLPYPSLDEPQTQAEASSLESIVKKFNELINAINPASTNIKLTKETIEYFDVQSFMNSANQKQEAKMLKMQEHNKRLIGMLKLFLTKKIGVDGERIKEPSKIQNCFQQYLDGDLDLNNL